MIDVKENEDGTMTPYFVSVLTGPDNWANYTYLGVIFDNGTFVHGKKSRIGKDAKSYKCFKWFWEQVNGEGLKLNLVEVWHEGKCGVCGRKLTVPESIESGLGPVCERKVA